VDMSLQNNMSTAVMCGNGNQSAKYYPNRTTLGIKKMTSCRFSRWRISAILDCRDPI